MEKSGLKCLNCPQSGSFTINDYTRPALRIHLFLSIGLPKYIKLQISLMGANYLQSVQYEQANLTEAQKYAFTKKSTIFT